MIEIDRKLPGILFLFIHMAIFSCVSPQPIIQLQPIAEATRFYQGAEYIESSVNNITAAVSFNKSRESTLIFDVEIINNSKKSLLIEPVSFYCLPFKTDPRGLDDRESNQISGNMTAIDPEQMILGINSRISQENADYSNDSAVNAAAGLLSVIGGFGASNNKEREEAFEMGEDVQDDSRDRKVEHNQRINSLNYQRDFWERYSIRKTTLDPGKSIKGSVSFYAVTSAKYIELYVPAGKYMFKFLFSQQMRRPSY